jgi:biotin carboxyl carrier protein
MIKKFKVIVDEKPYEVAVELPDEPALVTKSAPEKNVSVSAKEKEAESTPVTPVSSVTAGPGDVASPLAGRVVSIGVQPGQTVKEGDHVLTLEAMKMNTFVFAPKAGKIKEIKTKVGDGVQEGDILLTME